MIAGMLLILRTRLNNRAGIVSKESSQYIISWRDRNSARRHKQKNVYLLDIIYKKKCCQYLALAYRASSGQNLQTNKCGTIYKI